MSAFLGPIHTWLYNKIKFQEEIIQVILNAINIDGSQRQIELNMNDTYGVLEEGALEDIVDGGNIHGWLQQRVDVVEYRLAYLTTTLLKEKKISMKFLERILMELGKSKAKEGMLTPIDCLKSMEELLLDGMPCDRVNEIIQETPECIIVKRTKDIHAPYWEAIGGDVKNYYRIRNYFIEGFLHHTNMVMEVLDESSYQITRR